MKKRKIYAIVEVDIVLDIEHIVDYIQMSDNKDELDLYCEKLIEHSHKSFKLDCRTYKVIEL